GQPSVTRIAQGVGVRGLLDQRRRGTEWRHRRRLGRDVIGVGGAGRRAAGRAGGTGLIGHERTLSAAWRTCSSPVERSVRWSRRVGAPLDRSTARSPAAWAAMSWPKVYGRSGTARSSRTAPVICRKAPTGGPPLWYWPVEWRKRGPHPNVTGYAAPRARSPRR